MTRDPEIQALLDQLLNQVQSILGSHFIGMYLDGSLTNNTFDQASDIDFIVVSDQEIRGELFLALQSMHDRIASLETPWAIQLEGSYISAQALRRYDPGNALHPNLERGPGERLKLVEHHADWVLHRAIVRERGIVLVGPDPKQLIDPISATQLREAICSMLPIWAGYILDHPTVLHSRGYQSYVVLSLCRMLYTLQFGTIASKFEASQWAKQDLDQNWKPLIERAWKGRFIPDTDSIAEDRYVTQEFLHHTLACCQRSSGLRVV